MTRYGYTCAACGPFDLRAPMGAAPGDPACPRCGGAARRVWAVTDRRTAPALRQALGVADRSAHAPAVATRAPAPAPSAAPQHRPGRPALPRL